jgi:hypothetical protein
MLAFVSLLWGHVTEILAFYLLATLQISCVMQAPKVDVSRNGFVTKMLASWDGLAQYEVKYEVCAVHVASNVRKLHFALGGKRSMVRHTEETHRSTSRLSLQV